jgi:hypothetical protein
MPKGIYIRTEETRKNISLGHIGKPTWNKGKKLPQFSGKNHPMYGKKHSEESKRKMALVKIGYRASEETKRKMSLSKIGNHNHHSTGYRHSEETKQKLRLSKLGDKNPMFGKHPKNVFQEGHQISEEHKRKLSLIHKGKPLSEGHKMKLSIANLGKQLSVETRKKISLVHKGKSLSEEHKKKLGRRMEKHHNWKGGLSFEPYGLEFNNNLKEHIRNKYNYRCQQCFRHQGELFTKKGRKTKLHVHHIDFNKKNNCENNLIPLCQSCHMQTNYNRSDWITYFQGRVNGNF